MNDRSPAYTAMIFLSLTAGIIAAAQGPNPAQQKTAQPALKKTTLGQTINVHAFGPNLLCGQPSPSDFPEAKKRGIKTVITLRRPTELNWNEATAVTGQGMDFHQFGFGSPEALTDNIFDAALKVMADSKKSPVMLHCGSANRVGAIWLAHRVINDNLEIAAAQKEAKTVGLRTPGYEAKAIAYIKKKASDK